MPKAAAVARGEAAEGVVPAVAAPVLQAAEAAACRARRGVPAAPAHPEEDPRLRARAPRAVDPFRDRAVEVPLRDRPWVHNPPNARPTVAACHQALPPRVHPQEAGRWAACRIGRVEELPAVQEAALQTDRGLVLRAVQEVVRQIVRVRERETGLEPAM